MVSSANAKRAIFPAGYNGAYNQPGITAAQVLGYISTCNSLPGTTPSNSSWLSGALWSMAYPWHTANSSYTHFNTPNKLSCYSTSDTAGPGSQEQGGATGMITATSNHSGGVNVCMGDGSVKFVKDTDQSRHLVGHRHQERRRGREFRRLLIAPPGISSRAGPPGRISGPSGFPAEVRIHPSIRPVQHSGVAIRCVHFVCSAVWCWRIAIGGCGGGGLSEGVPENVDLNKQYTPPGKVGMITPGDQQKAIAAQKKAAAAAAPAGP